jgi:H+/Cl- antiporter ClcA
MPPNGINEPTGIVGTLLTSAACDILNTPVSSPEILLIIISSSVFGTVANVLLAINVLLIDVVNVFVVPPIWPSKVI